MSDTHRPTDPNESSDSNGGAKRRSPPAREDDPIEVLDTGTLDLRVGTDDCYKCSTCDTNCPVAAVDDDFPGPKFQGPEQWRLKRKNGGSIDESVMDCSNCLRCDSACPSGVNLSQMHNEARGEYVAEQQSVFSRTFWRNKLLANYRKQARLASRFPRLSNALLSSSAVRFLAEKVLGITAKREFVGFAEQSFVEWWDERGGEAVSRDRARRRRNERGIDGDDRRIAYFHGCYANYNTPAVAKALVRVYEYFGYQVTVPAQGCSGTPMFANGMIEDARAEAEVNVSSLGGLVDAGYDVVCSCTSCSLSLKQEYPELFEIDGVETVAEHTYEALEYLRIQEDLRGELAESSLASLDLAYHAPCHARNQGLARQAVDLFDELDGVTVADVGESCSGISGTYGWKAEKYDRSMAIGSEMFEEMARTEAETGLTECPTCAMQMEEGTGYEVKHPLEILEAALLGESADG